MIQQRECFGKYSGVMSKTRGCMACGQGKDCIPPIEELTAAGNASNSTTPRNKYHREITKPAVVDGREVVVTISVDIYDILHAWKVSNPALAHLVKKAMQPGQRGHKDRATDMAEIVQSAIRARELEQ